MPQATLAGVTLDYAIEGPRHGQPLLLIMGLGMQRVAWPDSLLAALHARGLRTITFDNRDVGLSTRYDEHPLPGLLALAGHRLLGTPLELPYRLPDLADDAARLLDHLDVAHAHVLGISMGGMVATHLATREPQRVRTLTLMATSSGRLGLPLPRPRVMRVVMTRPASSAPAQAAVDYMVRLFTAIGSPGYPTARAELERRARRHVERAPRGTGLLRQFNAIVADGDRSALLRALKLPVLIMHGSADPMMPPAHGRDLVRCLPRARFERIEGWAHDLPDALAERFAALVAEHAGAA
jgi:pimeloyl-ACP methyl ester carboxylesterase